MSIFYFWFYIIKSIGIIFPCVITYNNSSKHFFFCESFLITKIVFSDCFSVIIMGCYICKNFFTSYNTFRSCVNPNIFSVTIVKAYFIISLRFAVTCIKNSIGVYVIINLYVLIENIISVNIFYFCKVPCKGFPTTSCTRRWILRIDSFCTIFICNFPIIPITSSIIAEYAVIECFFLHFISYCCSVLFNFF